MKSLLDIFANHNPRYAAHGEIRMQCPFRENHEGGADGSKSFFVNPEKGVYNCFSCNASGDLPRLLTTRFGIPVYDALEYISLDHLEEKITGEEDSSYVPSYTPELPLTWDKLPEYYLDRGFSKNVLKKFRVGTYKNDYRETVITVPVYRTSKMSDLVGVLHTIKDRAEGERSFWFEPSGFNRSHMLYNLHDLETATLVEGPSDVWKCHQNERPDAVGCFGTKLTLSQAELLGKYKLTRLAYDNDLAGLMATEFAYHVLKNKTEIRIVIYPAKDPGATCMRDWKVAYDAAVDYAEYHFTLLERLGEEYETVLEITKKRLKKLGIFI